MKDLLELFLSELDENNSMEHVRWLTENAPNRISGKGEDLKAANYIIDQMKSYGLETKLIEFETYNSWPRTSELKIISPEERLIESLPCCHVESTLPQGEELELVYVGPGGYDDYVGKDVKGKAVLVEVSYAPATPEKARIAAEKGAVAIICMNWGRDDNDYICMRALKAVWGNPTPESFNNIPKISGLSVSRKEGQYLKRRCLENNSVKIFINVKAERHWCKVQQPMGILRGTEEPEKFLLAAAHLDVWSPGATDNATGDATMLELARVFAKHRDKIKRSIYFLNWNGHEIAEAAGSTWFADHYFDDLDKNCIGYIVVDSTGLAGATVYYGEASRELSDFAEKAILNSLKEKRPVKYLPKNGDQSFFGIGVPSVVGRMTYTPEEIKETNGATLGWWNHSTADGMDKVDPAVLEKDIKVNCSYFLGLLNPNVLPYDFTKTCMDISTKLENINKVSGDIIELGSIISNVNALKGKIEKLNVIKDELLKTGEFNDKSKIVNKCLMKLSRLLTSSIYTYTDRFEQDTYGLSVLDKPIPLLQDSVTLKSLSPEEQEYKLLYTKAVRNRNRVSDAINNALEFVEAYLNVLEYK